MLRGARGERGATAVEFALVFCFVVLPVTFGILQYGYHYWALSTADAAAREAARSLSVGTDWACTRSAAIGKVSGPAVGDRAPDATMSYASGSSTPAIGDIVRVRVEFDSLYVGFLPLPDGGAVDRTAEARVESVPETALPC